MKQAYRHVLFDLCTVRNRSIALALLLVTAAAAQENTGPSSMPSADQLLQVPIGGTHVPLTTSTEQIKNPYEGNSDAIAQGRALFDAMNCSGCHASKGGGGMGPPLSDKVWIYGGEPAQIYMTIVQGRPNGMPSFGSALPPEAIWKLVSYVRTLSESSAEPKTAHAKAKQSGKP
jgi:cytochrome c oxidase cbb3-type subunit 3